MANKRVSKKVLTEEERIATSIKSDIDFLKNQIDFVGTPTYSFDIGEEVVFGGFKKRIIKEKLFDGKAYVLECTNEKDEVLYRVATWVSIRPMTCKDTHFAVNYTDTDLVYYPSTIDSLLAKYYDFGVDMCPDYQRDYVWTDEDKNYLLESVFLGLDIGKFVFVHNSDKKWHETGFSYEILDGKQRLSTLLAFYENRLPYKGYYYNDLSAADRRAFRNLHVTFAELTTDDRNTILKCFVKLNRGGRIMDKEHLHKVEEMIK